MDQGHWLSDDLGLPLPLSGPQFPFCNKKALDWVS